LDLSGFVRTHERGTFMAQAKHGDTVRVHYHGTLEDGTVFSSTYEEEEPFEFTIGKESVLPSFEEALIGMQEGDTATVSVAPEDGYGQHKREFVFAMDRKQAPADLKLEVGKRLQVRSNEGKMALAVITAITEDSIILDANDPLAGKTLNFKIELIKIL
jgi:peptidylprolyl isomerase